MKGLKQKIVFSMFVILSLFVFGNLAVEAQTNIPPTVDAGIDITIGVIDVATTTLYGSVTDPDNTGFLKCAWENNSQQLTNLMSPNSGGICAVDLSTLNNPGAGVYTLILYGLDGSVVAFDSMLLTIIDSNSGPIVNAGPDITITNDQIATTIIQGDIIDPYNTNPLSCAWYENGMVQLTPILAVGPNGECDLDLSLSLQPFVNTGSYTLILYGIEGNVIFSDTMILTIIPPINTPATVNAGSDMEITTDDIATTIIYGSVTDPDNTGTLLCAWADSSVPGQEQQLTMLIPVVNNICELDLGIAGSQYFGIGEYTLTLYALDGSFISSDSMLLTIIPANIAPVAFAGLNIFILTEQIAATVIQGTATDADGDPLSCSWTDGLNELLYIPNVTSSACPLDLSTLSLGIGTYSLFLSVDDGQTTHADEMILTIDNTPPVADAGATTSNTICLATSCEITLNGSQSTDIDSTFGTNDDIVTFEWVENNVVIATGETAPVMLALGMHDITLKVTDSAGDTNEVTITIVIDPAELAFDEIDKAHVKRDGKIKIAGRIALPAGVSHFDVNSIGRSILGLRTLDNVNVTAIDESVNFLEHSNGNKWKYKANTPLGITKFSIDWSGAKFHYYNFEHDLTIKTYHIGETETELKIRSCSPVTIDINGTIITIDANDNVSSSHSGVKIDRDDDGDSDDSDSDGGHPTTDDSDCTIGITLPFALTPDMEIIVTGTLNDTILVANGYTAAVGKFKLHGRFDATAIPFTSLTPWLETTITLGNEGFTGTLVIDDLTWTQIKSKHWKYKSK